MSTRRRGIDFVKVHAGWDEVIFLYGNQVPEGKELGVGLSLLKRPSLRGTEVGILYEPEEGGDIKVKMLDATSNDFIAMCGGLTQSLGKAVVESDVGKHFGMKIKEPRTEFILETDTGPIPIEVEVDRYMAKQITTNMRSYIKECYECGVRQVKVRGIDAVAVGITPSRREFLVFKVDSLNNEFPSLNFWRKEPETLNVLKELYGDFIDGENLTGFSLYGVLYDMHPEGSGEARYVYRPFPIMYENIDRDIEMACGTGITAVGIAMLENGDLNLNDGIVEMLFEVGSKNIIRKPYQVETRLKADIKNGKIDNAEFSHSLIEMIACGKVYVSTQI